jgi:hypothetical protein
MVNRRRHQHASLLANIGAGPRPIYPDFRLGWGRPQPAALWPTAPRISDRAALRAPSRGSGAFVRSSTGTSRSPFAGRGPLEEALMQLDTEGRAAADDVSYGGANHLAAASKAALGIGGGGTVLDRYVFNLEQEKERDQYDRLHRKDAVAAGTIIAELLLAGAGGGKAVSIAEKLPSRTKGTLGEAMSAVKSVLEADPPKKFQSRIRLQRGHTIADHETLRGRVVEAKFGPTAKLTPAQTRAQVQFGDRYRYDHWYPEDLFPIGAAVPPAFNALVRAASPYAGRLASAIFGADAPGPRVPRPPAYFGSARGY